MDDYVTSAQAAELLGVSAGRVRQLVASGALPQPLRVGNTNLHGRGDVERLRAERGAEERQEPGPDGAP
jgi:excisionase family DNA binding protein